jgi:hypothetical protein
MHRGSNLSRLIHPPWRVEAQRGRETATRDEIGRANDA